MENDTKKITEYMFMALKPYRVDLIMVSGTRHKEATKMAGKLYLDGYAGKILVSGGENRIYA